MSLAKKHKAARKAQFAAQTIEQHAAVRNEAGSAVATNYVPDGNAPLAVLLAALQNDLAALHDITDVQKKIALKKEHLIPKWLPFVEQYIQSGAHHPFEPLVRLAIWLIDAEQIDKAIELTDFAIKQQQKMPENFSRDLDSFAAEAIHDWAFSQFKAGHSAEPYFTHVVERVESKQWLVTQPIILNKLFKLVALVADKDNELEKAETYFLKCVEVNPKGHGVKGVLHAVQKKLGKPPTVVY